MKKIIIFVFLFFLFTSNYVLSAPAPWGIAINEEKRQCAGYWGGDEHNHYTLPSGWEDYYVEEFKDGIIVDECLGNDYNETGYRRCCDQIDYEYVSSNIGAGIVSSYNNEEQVEKELEWSDYVIFFGILLLVVLVLMTAFYIKKKK